MPATTRPAEDPTEHVDVLIVGAGLSGIGAACHLETGAPGFSYAILEARGTSGGTWDLFRSPGVRSDSDMFTLSYGFRPWTGTRSIADGEEILRYLRATAAEYGVDRHIRYHSRVTAAEWAGAHARWTVTVEHPETGERTTRTCGFLYLCPGYYRYDEGYTPDWPGRESFGGQVVHPQHWPADLDVTGRRVVVGSGATAVTLVPVLARTAARVTMLQRSPSYVLPIAAHDAIADLLRRLLPERRAHDLIRRKNIRTATALYTLSRRYPGRIRALLRKAAVKRLPPGFDVDTHFAPTYEPWDQRMCFVPGGDLFGAIRSGKADVVTDHIEEFTATGLQLRSGTHLDADVVVTATGLHLLPLGGIPMTVDGEPVVVPQRVAGSPAVGREVARAAAENLVPVTLELGGKCPAILTADSVDADSVRNVVGTKLIKNGQMCISVDYALVPRAHLDDFVGHARRYLGDALPGYAASPHSTGIITQRHADRLTAMLDEARAAGARVVELGGAGEEATRRLPLALVVDPPPDLRIMQEEIFGPILPVVAYDGLDEALAQLNAGERPLGLYVFSKDPAVAEDVLRRTTSGGACVNICAVQGALPALGFGGIGRSGHGRHHGIEGFREFSNPRGVVVRGTGDLAEAFLPPYGPTAQAVVDGAFGAEPTP